MKEFRQNTAGFTLIEMAVALAVGVIITAVVIGNLGAIRFRLALTRSAQKLSLDLHRVGSDSLTSREFKAAGVPNGWGMHFYGAGSTRYTVFADVDGDEIRASNESEDLESFNFEPGVTITSSNITDVVFVPPDPTIIFTAVPPVTSASIILSTVDGSLTRTITINKFGAITIQ